MIFISSEKWALLAVKGIDPAVIKRFEGVGISSLVEMATYNANDIVKKVASMMLIICWKNSPSPNCD